MTDLIIRLIIGVIGMTALALFGGFFVQGVDRKLAAMMQSRIGPLIRQPWYDFLKLLGKENVVPQHAIPSIYNTAPVIAFAAVVTILLYMPMAGFAPVLEGYGDLILVLYLFAIPGLAMVFGGFASGSPYATIGAQREMVTMISYELPLGGVIIAFAWKMAEAGLTNPFSLQTIAENPVWNLVGPFGIIGFILLFLAIELVTPAELSKVPFDSPEAKSELAEGILVEYSGRNLALFYGALGGKMIAMTALTVAMFFPYNISGLFAVGQTGAVIIDILFFLIKFFIVMFLTITLVRVVMARFRITQVVEIYWKLAGTMTVLGLILIMLDSKL